MAKLEELILDYGLELQDDGSVKYTLEYPTAAVSEVTIKRPTAGIIVDASQGATTAYANDCYILAKVTGQALPFFSSAELDAADLQAMRAIADAFEDAAPPGAEGRELEMTDADGGKLFPLAKPIQSEGVTIDAILLRRLNSQDMQAAEAATGSQLKRAHLMLSRIGSAPGAAHKGLPMTAIRSMDCFDQKRIAGVVLGFLNRSRRTGGTS